MYYLGIDFHTCDSYIAVLDDDGDVVEEVRVQNTNLNDIAKQYAGSKAAIEATSSYYTIYDTLDEYLDVVVADPYQTKAIGIAEVKTDRLGEAVRAASRRAGMIAESYVPPSERRTLVCGRKRLVEKHTDLKNEVHAVLNHHGIENSWDPFSKEGREILAGEDLSIGLVGQGLIESFLAMINELTAQVETIEGVIGESAASFRETQLLMTIPGVSFYSSLLITAELGEIDRFDRDTQVVSCAGLDPSSASRLTRGLKEGSRSVEAVTCSGSSSSVRTLLFIGATSRISDDSTLG